MIRDYIIEKTTEGILLVRENIENRVIRYAAGLSAADPGNPERPRDRCSFLNDFLAPMIESGKIGNGVKTKFDDRKFRFDSAFIHKNVLELKLGITYYQECDSCRKRTEEKRNRLAEEGRKRFNDSHAFFTRGCGIEVTPITADGSIFVGKREVKEESSGYSGELSAINGWIDYKADLRSVNFEEDAIREMKEEFGIREGEVNRLIFSGIFSALSEADTDFVYLAHIKLPDTFFSGGEYKAKRKDAEHGELVKIATFRDMQTLLETGELPGYKDKFNVLYSLRASLESIRPGEMAS